MSDTAESDAPSPSDLAEAEADERVVLCDANTPPVERGRYFIGYVEMVDGYWHAWHDGKRVRHSRTPNHPADPRCPECNPTEDKP